MYFLAWLKDSSPYAVVNTQETTTIFTYLRFNFHASLLYFSIHYVIKQLSNRNANARKFIPTRGRVSTTDRKYMYTSSTYA